MMFGPRYQRMGDASESPGNAADGGGEMVPLDPGETLCSQINADGTTQAVSCDPKLIEKPIDPRLRRKFYPYDPLPPANPDGTPKTDTILKSAADTGSKLSPLLIAGAAIAALYFLSK